MAQGPGKVLKTAKACGPSRMPDLKRGGHIAGKEAMKEGESHRSIIIAPKKEGTCVSTNISANSVGSQFVERW